MNPTSPKHRTLIIWSLASTLAVFTLPATAQTVIGGDTIDASAMLDVQASDKGFLLPRLSTGQRNAMPRPAKGLLIFNTTLQCVEINLGTPDAPVWKCLSTRQGTLDLSALDTAYWNRKLNPGDTLSLSNRLDKVGLPQSDNNPGNILYWNGSTWTRLAPGLPGQLISLSPEGFPVWTGAALASLTTATPTAITPSSATVGGQIASNGGATVSARGIVWGTTTNPTLSASVLPLGSGNGSFSGTLGGLTPNTLYYLRAYATNSAGTAYGNQQSFVTGQIVTNSPLPRVTSISISELSTIQATFNAKVDSQGAGLVTERGIVWNNTGNPTVNSNRIPSGAGLGTYSVKLVGLSSGSKYYIRAYAINNFGIAYSEQIPFVTSTGLASVTTNSIFSQSTTASSGGRIIDNGGSKITAKGVVWNTTGTPTIFDSKTVDSAYEEVFISNLTDLNPNTIYYLRAYATNSSGTSYGDQLSFKTTTKTLLVSDIDGNTYNTVQIGTQLWTSENLKTTRYRNGDPIPYVLGSPEWESTGAWNYYNHEEGYNHLYGKLYNWYAAADPRGICPTGWHVPTNEDLTVLMNYLGGESVAGGKMKAVGTRYWDSPNTGGTNESGFNALPGGNIQTGSSERFGNIGSAGAFWCTTENNSSGQAVAYSVAASNSTLTLSSFFSKTNGHSLRCIQD